MEPKGDPPSQDSFFGLFNGLDSEAIVGGRTLRHGIFLAQEMR